MFEFFDGLLTKLRLFFLNRFFKVNLLVHVPSFAKGPFGMVFEHFRDVFDFEDFANNFIQLY